MITPPRCAQKARFARPTRHRNDSRNKTRHKAVGLMVDALPWTPPHHIRMQTAFPATQSVHPAALHTFRRRGEQSPAENPGSRSMWSRADRIRHANEY